LCDKRIPVGLKGKIYCIVVISVLLYGTECWPIKKTRDKRLLVAKTRMTTGMCGHTRWDGMKNEVIRNKVKVTPIDNKIRETNM